MPTDVVPGGAAPQRDGLRHCCPIDGSQCVCAHKQIRASTTDYGCMGSSCVLISMTTMPSFQFNTCSGQSQLRIQYNRVQLLAIHYHWWPAKGGKIIEIDSPFHFPMCTEYFSLEHNDNNDRLAPLPDLSLSPDQWEGFTPALLWGRFHISKSIERSPDKSERLDYVGYLLSFMMHCLWPTNIYHSVFHLAFMPETNHTKVLESKVRPPFSGRPEFACLVNTRVQMSFSHLSKRNK